VLFAVLAAQGLAQAATGEGRIFWRISVSEAGRVFGPYIDPTHFAGVMELAVPWLVGYVLSRERSEGWQALARPKAALAAGAAVLCFVAGLATASKMAAALLVMSSVALFLVRAHGTRQRLAVLGGAAVLLPLAALAVSQTHLGERVAEFVVTRGQMSGSDRVVGWRTALSVLADFPLTGTGFGTFRQVFPRYLPAGESSQWQQLHNDYLEVLLDGGLIAGAMIGWLAWGYGRRALALLRSGHGIRSHLSRCGALFGVIALSLHALVEFNHQMPANALLFVVVAAAAVTPRAGNAERVS
jgi:O-antigen ligase